MATAPIVTLELRIFWGFPAIPGVQTIFTVKTS